MTLQEILGLLRECPIVASVQASDGSPLSDSQTILMLAQASIQEGVKVLRIEGAANIRTIKAATRVPVIGLIKRRCEGSEIYITPTEREVEELLEARCDVLAMDATRRPRPGKALAELVQTVHRGGALALGDCDTAESIQSALTAGFDIVGTTLAGYTAASGFGKGPDLDLVRKALAVGARVVLAEGRYEEPWQAQAALRIGAAGVVVGGALNDPVKQTRRFVRVASSSHGGVGAVDLGGTWLRFGIFTPDWELTESWKIERPDNPQDRLDWIARQVQAAGLRRVGVSSGGVINPSTGSVVKAKSIIPGHVGTRFDRQSLGANTVALNDGLAAAWGHACHPRFAGRRVATLSLGTGVGFGLVDHGRILMGPLGEPPHVNDLPFGETTIEGALGGAHGPSPTHPYTFAHIHPASAFRHAVEVIRALYHPDATVVCGSVGLTEWLSSTIHELGVETSPLGSDAGLYGAAALALFPPEFA